MCKPFVLDSVFDSAVDWARSFLGVEVILFCTCTRVQVRNTAALCGFTFLLADSRKEPPLRAQVGDWCGQCPLTSLCTHVVTCILISGSICEFACFTQADTHFMQFFFAIGA